MKTSFKCSCGEWHEVGEALANHIETIGPSIRLRSSEGIWFVPRVFIAVHGKPTLQSLARQAETYGWKPVKRHLRSVSA